MQITSGLLTETKFLNSVALFKLFRLFAFHCKILVAIVAIFVLQFALRLSSISLLSCGCGSTCRYCVRGWCFSRQCGTEFWNVYIKTLVRSINKIAYHFCSDVFRNIVTYNVKNMTACGNQLTWLRAHVLWCNCSVRYFSWGLHFLPDWLWHCLNFGVFLSMTPMLSLD